MVRPLLCDLPVQPGVARVIGLGQEGGGVSKENSGRDITASMTSRHTSVIQLCAPFQNGAQSCTRRAVKKCRIFFGKTDLFAVVGNAEVSTIIYELYLLFFCEPKTFDSFIVRKKHFTNEKIRRASLLAG